MSAQTRRIVYHFRGAHSPPAVASRQGDFCSLKTGSCTVASVSLGSLDLALDATNEVQNACLYMGNILPFDIDEIVRVEFIAKLTASLGASVMGAFGLAGARNDALDSVAQHAWFRFEGSNAIVCESDDGTTDQDDKATGQTLVASYKRFAIDFSVGNLTQSPPSLSKGGTADVRFFMGNERGAMNRVAGHTRFDMSAYTSGLQLFAQIQKTSGTAVGTLSLLEAAVELRLPA